MKRSAARSRTGIGAAAAAVAVVVALGGALPAAGAELPDSAGGGLGGASEAPGTWSTGPEGAGPALPAQQAAPPSRTAEVDGTGSISGAVSYADSEGTPVEPGDGTTIELDRLVDGSGDAETGDFEHIATANGPDYRFEGLAAGKYRLHFIGDAEHDVRDEYYDDTPFIWDADLITLAEGQSVEGIEALLRPWGVYTDRYGGATRYDVAALISTLAFEPGVPVVYVASGEKFPDALSAGPAAARQDGALLLTASGSVPQATREAIQELEPEKIVVVGGEASVSAAAYAELAALQPNIERIGGSDRYAVSRNVIDYAFCDGPDGECAAGAETVFAADGGNFPDALSAGPAAAHVDGAVLLVPGKGRVDAATAALLQRLGTEDVFVVGGPASVSESIESELITPLPPGGGVSRIGGADRYEVSANVNATVFDTGDAAFLASGAVFADALSGGPVAATIDAPIFLVQRDCYPESVWNGIRRYDPIELLLLGGPNTLSDSVLHVEYLC